MFTATKLEVQNDTSFVLKCCVENFINPLNKFHNITGQCKMARQTAYLFYL
jgi:hypothetical protein